MGNKRNVRWQSSKPPSPNPTEHLGSPEPQSLSARMRKLSREYGWSALGVYLGLSALDFPFCFLAVRLLGTERIGRWEDVIVQAFWRGVEKVYPEARANTVAVLGDGAREGGNWGVEEADAKAHSDSASEYTWATDSRSTHVCLHHRSSMDTARVGIRHSQVIHIHPGASDRSTYTKGRQGTEKLGLEHWQEKTKSVDGVGIMERVPIGNGRATL